MNKKTKLDLLKSYAFIWWDGLGFFGFDETKLGRLRGQPVTIFTKFRSKKWVVVNFCTLAIVIYVVLSQGSRLSTLKSQQISLLEKPVHDFNSLEILSMHGVTYFDVDEILDRIREF